MASRALPTKTPSQSRRPTRRATAELVDHVGRRHPDVASAPDPTGGRVRWRDRQPAEPSTRSVPSTGSAPSPPMRVTSRSAAHNSTLLFRALLLIAAAAALAFTVAALIAPPNGTTGSDATSPDAPPPAVFVQPDR